MTRLESLGENIHVLVQGASRGLGLEFVRQLLHCSNVARVWAACREPDALLLASQTPLQALRPLRMDVTDEQSIIAAAAQLAGETSQLSLILNVAGVLHTPQGMRPERQLADVEARHMLEAYRVNTLGPLLVAKHFAALLPRRDRAVFASLSARVGSIGDNRLGGWYAYRASKAAQNMVTRNLSIELPRRHHGLLVIALHPGTVDTALSSPFQGNVPEGRLFTPEQAVAQLLQIIDTLRADDQGRFIAWDGQTISW